MANSANSTNGIFSMIPAALTLASSANAYTNAIIDSVFLDHRPIVNGAVGQRIEILVPNVNSSNAVNIGSGPLIPNVTAHNKVELAITQKVSNTYPLPLYNNALSEVDLATFYFQPWLEELTRAVAYDFTNVLIGGQAPMPVVSTTGTARPAIPVPTNANFAANGVVTGGGVGHPNRNDLAKASGELFNQGAPVTDAKNMMLLTSGGPYYGMTADPSFSQAYFVGDNAAIEAQQHAVLKTMSGATVLADQNFPVGTGANTSVYSMFFHRYAHGARFAVETPAHNRVSEEMIIYPKPGMPVRVTYFHSPKDQADYISFNVLYGVAVIRDDWRVLIQN